MAANEIHKNDIGSVFRVTIKDGDSVVDLSAASTKQLLFRKPEGSLLTKDASFYTDGSDGIIQYTTQSSDLDTIGTWSLQAYVVIGGNSFHSDVGSFKVYENLN